MISLRSAFSLPLFCLSTLPAGVPEPAAAHPHAWIDTAVTLRFDDAQRLVALEARWIFDDMYSAYAVEGLDTDADGRYSAEELAPFAERSVANLREWGYFTVLKAGGERIALGPATVAGVAFVDGRVDLSLSLPLETPVDPRRAPVSLAMFDPTFYVEMVPLKEAPVRLASGAPEECGAAVQPLVLEEPRFIADATVEAMEIDPADSENGPGARFAEWIALTCSDRDD